MSFPKLVALLVGRAIETLFLTCLNFLGSLKSKANLIQVLSLYICVFFLLTENFLSANEVNFILSTFFVMNIVH